jgi:hypothetical protein
VTATWFVQLKSRLLAPDTTVSSFNIHPPGVRLTLTHHCICASPDKILGRDGRLQRATIALSHERAELDQ